jgi:hypothetical protein
MSLGKTSEVGQLGKVFEGLTFEEIKEKIIQKFSEAYGRYENISGKMWVEVYHNEGDKTNGNVIWRKGTLDEVTEETILSIPQAIGRFMNMIEKGYSLSFKGVTQSDMDKGNAVRLETQSTPKKQGLLGTYYKGGSFIRFNQFKADEYYIEYGYDSAVTRTEIENESGLRFELNKALANGFTRDGLDNTFVNPMEAFGLGLDTLEANEEQERLAKEATKPVDGELPNDFFDLMR